MVLIVMDITIGNKNFNYMKKNIKYFLISIILISSFSGCGDSDSGGAENNNAQHQKQSENGNKYGNRPDNAGNNSDNQHSGDMNNSNSQSHENRPDDAGNHSNSEKKIQVDEDGNVLNSQILNGIESDEVNQTERELLLLMREEEKFARDVYITLNNKWGNETNIFKNIGKAEQTHVDLIQDLLKRYDIPDPVTNEDEVGKFENQDLQDLYDKLINKGERSLEDALEVGAMVEDKDIKDLEDSIVQTDNEDVKVVFQGLIDGSENHMRGFLKALSQEKGYSSTNSDLYKPNYITQERYDQIFETDPNNSVGTTANGEAPPSIPE